MYSTLILVLDTQINNEANMRYRGFLISARALCNVALSVYARKLHPGSSYFT